MNDQSNIRQFALVALGEDRELADSSSRPSEVKTLGAKLEIMVRDLIFMGSIEGSDSVEDLQNALLLARDVLIDLQELCSDLEDQGLLNLRIPAMKISEAMLFARIDRRNRGDTPLEDELELLAEHDENLGVTVTPERLRNLSKILRMMGVCDMPVPDHFAEA